MKPKQVIKTGSVSRLTRIGVRLIVIPLLLYSCTNSDHTQKDTNRERQQLLETVYAFNKAFKACDIEKLSSYITENYQHTNGNSKSIGKSNWIAYLHQRKKDIETGNLVINTYEMKETEVVLYNDTAIVTAKIITSGYKLGALQENEYRITNIWVKEQGKWKRAGFHDGKIK